MILPLHRSPPPPRQLPARPPQPPSPAFSSVYLASGVDYRSHPTGPPVAGSRRSRRLLLPEERLHALHTDAVALREAEVNGAVAFELLSRVHEDDTGEAPAAVVAEVMGLRRSLAMSGSRPPDRR